MFAPVATAVNDVVTCVPAETGLALGAHVPLFSMVELLKMNQKQLRSFATRHKI